MCKVEIIEEEILIVKQAISELKDRLSVDQNKIGRDDTVIIDNILKKIKIELNK